MHPRIVALAALLSVISISCATPQSASTPLWRIDTSHLESDKAAARACLARPSGELDRCVRVVQQNCPGWTRPSPEDMARDDQLTWIPAQARQCDWRAIAAWEDLMQEALAALAPSGREHELDASQQAWEASMLADVAYAASAYEGGSLEWPTAASARSESVARRVIWLERQRRETE